MAVELSERLVIGISSRSLFDLSEENRIFKEQGLAAYVEYQHQNRDKLLAPGPAFQVIRRFLRLNKMLRLEADDPAVEVVIMSHNSAETSFRIWKAISHYKLPITRAVFSGGESLAKYLEAFSIDLFLSSDIKDVQRAINDNCAAAHLRNQSMAAKEISFPLRLAFDGDCVLFSDEAEQKYKEGGLALFQEHEAAKANVPLPAGPFAKFLGKLILLQQRFRDFGFTKPPIRTALVTARNAPAHERVLFTLQEWGLWLDESFFLGGVEKGPILKALGTHIFFDDQPIHLESAGRNEVVGALVPTIKPLEEPEPEFSEEE
jgi:5''-nucleotidase.